MPTREVKSLIVTSDKYPDLEIFCGLDNKVIIQELNGNDMPTAVFLEFSVKEWSDIVAFINSEINPF